MDNLRPLMEDQKKKIVSEIVMDLADGDSSTLNCLHCTDDTSMAHNSCEYKHIKLENNCGV